MAAAAADPSTDQQLIVFVQPEFSDLAREFQAHDLARLEALAGEMGLIFQVVNVAEGVPAEVTLTPLVVYQNYRGRSIYQGRYRTPQRLRSFIYTARVLPQEDRSLEFRQTDIMRLERVKVALPVKITDLAGMTPDGFNAVGFDRQMRDAITKGMKRSLRLARETLGRGDRKFYLEFYPFVSEEGVLYLGMAIFSQFHCHEPVFSRTEDPVSGPWCDRAAVFAQAAAVLEEEVVKLIGGSELGDGFDPVSSQTPVVPWERMGLDLPSVPMEVDLVDLPDIQLSAHWGVDRAPQVMQPPVQFQFPAPLQMYWGQARKLTGTITFTEDLLIAKASGRFVVEVASITMGEPDLDEQIHVSMLKSAKYPTSHFVFDAIRSEKVVLVIGEIISVTLVGTFEMKGVSIPLEVPASLEVFLDDAGKPRLSIDGRWQIRLRKPFDLAGPEGPEPANDTLVYRCHIVLQTAAGR